MGKVTVPLGTGKLWRLGKVWHLRNLGNCRFVVNIARVVALNFGLVPHQVLGTDVLVDESVDASEELVCIRVREETVWRGTQQVAFSGCDHLGMLHLLASRDSRSLGPVALALGLVPHQVLWTDVLVVVAIDASNESVRVRVRVETVQLRAVERGG